ncbi:recombinase family protein [Dyella sp. 2HG41-7]|uniref:recombinase family protein n=1 Tax=Dyella sp. 2HG41-7 TaxID=2883239 RepID=UPI0021071E4B|nr:recombinase family protein [Dyella sp. 2HG41-7]
MGGWALPSHQGETRQPTRVAQYIRMSTDFQRYSTENQRDALDKYASQHGMTIVHTYADEGKSGLNFEGRDALQRLIQDVQYGHLNFNGILVYDISRWGRFQDADESAYYEYLCRRAGIEVFYCAEPFENDGSPMATIMKSVKRAMAGEYSRELSCKVFQGQCRLIELGFHQGGSSGFGLRRMLLDEQRVPKGLLKRGERKSVQTDRVILVPGPDHEVATVRSIYQAFLKEGKSEQAIANTLNENGIRMTYGRPWNREAVHRVLTSEKYIGNNVFNRTSFKLKRQHVQNSPDTWVRKDGAFQPIVPTEWFTRAQAIFAKRNPIITDEEMLAKLKSLLDRTGSLSAALIDKQEDMPRSGAYIARFGSLLGAYALAGYRPQRDYRHLTKRRMLREVVKSVIAEIITELQKVHAEVRIVKSHGFLRINDEFTLTVALTRCLRMPSGEARWRLRFDSLRFPDFTVVIRMSEDQTTPLDYFVIPRSGLSVRCAFVDKSVNSTAFRCYRIDNLDLLYALAERRPLHKIP